MSLFEHVPYTNFHDLNLSWLLKFTNNVKGRLDEIDESVEAAQTAEAGAQAAEAGALDAQTAAEDAQTAAETAAAQAEASAGNAGTYANNAATSAGQAANSAQQAATNATNAAGSASGAGQSATSAQQAATNAASSASAAGTSASAAAGSASAAQAAQTAAQAAQAAAEAAAAGMPSESTILEKALKQTLPLCFITGGGVATVRSQATKPNINNLYEQYSGMVEMIMPAGNYWQDPYDDIVYDNNYYRTFRIMHPSESGSHAFPILIQQGQNLDRFIVYPSTQVGDYVDADGDMHVFGRVWDIVNNNWAADGTSVGPLVWLIVPTFNSTFGDNQ